MGNLRMRQTSDPDKANLRVYLNDTGCFPNWPKFVNEESPFRGRNWTTCKSYTDGTQCAADKRCEWTRNCSWSNDAFSHSKDNHHFPTSISLFMQNCGGYSPQDWPRWKRYWEHELVHHLGVGNHSNNPENLMHPTPKMEKVRDTNHTQVLNALYSHVATFKLPEQVLDDHRLWLKDSSVWFVDTVDGMMQWIRKL